MIDEIETHLHLEMQKKILPSLTTLFPRLQFIISTHSPFVLSSLDNVVIYDLENRMLVRQPQGLTDIPYEGIVEGYFGADSLSDKLRKKYEEHLQHHELIVTLEKTSFIWDRLKSLQNMLYEKIIASTKLHALCFNFIFYR